MTAFQATLEPLCPCASRNGGRAGLLPTRNGEVDKLPKCGQRPTLLHLAPSPAKESQIIIVRSVFRILAWLTLGAIVILTLSNSQLRPELDQGASFDRAIAYLVLGGLFSAAYPRQRAFALCIAALAAVGLEFAQLLTPDRHARLTDAAVKLCSGALGVAGGTMITSVFERFRVG